MASVAPEPPSLIPVVLSADSGRQQLREQWQAALNAFRANDYTTAIRLFDEIPVTEKGVNTYKGISYYRIGDCVRTMQYLEKAVEQDSGDFEAQKTLCYCYYKNDALEKALAHAEAALAVREDVELRRLYEKLGKDSKVQLDYIEESSAHFKVLFEGYRQGTISRQVLSVLEDAYSHVGKEMNVFLSEPVTAILYTNQDFTDVTRAPAWSHGQYDGKIRIPVKGVAGYGATLKKVLFHEYVHAVVRSITPRVPQWLNEGLAEYLSTTYPKRIGQAIPLNQLEVSFRNLSGRDVNTAYWESYSAVSHLVEKYGMYRVKDLLIALADGQGMDAAFLGCFGISYRAFQEAWGKSQ